MADSDSDDPSLRNADRLSMSRDYEGGEFIDGEFHYCKLPYLARETVGGRCEEVGGDGFEALA